MLSQQYDFWLFDLDGTLVDVDWSYTRGIFDRVGERLGRNFSDRETELLWHGLRGARDPLLREWGIDPYEFWPALHAVEDPLARAEETFLHDDAAALLDQIDRPIGLVTHCQQFLAEPVLDRLDLRDRFDVVICCTDETGWKPDPAPVERAMKLLGVDDGHRGVLAGDGSNDIGAAWNAGLDGIHVERHDPHRRGECVLGDYRVTSFDELWDVEPVASD
jgi:phosphoglycolate phosphatase